MAAAIEAHVEDTLTDADRAAQLAYHTLYLFQVLTLDRGTTHGVLAHNENDVGTLGSLPSAVDLGLLQEWATRLESPQDELVAAIVNVLQADKATADGDNGGSSGTRVKVTDKSRAALAEVLRKHYRGNRAAMGMQADLDMPWWDARKEHRKAAGSQPS